MLFIAAAGAASAEKVVVIVNAANSQEVTATDLKNMYNDIVIHWGNNQPIDMYDTPVAAEARIDTSPTSGSQITSGGGSGST